MFPCQSFGNVNNIICAMINFFENVYISLCYFLRLFVTLKSDLDREPKIVLWFWALSLRLLFYTVQGTL